MMPFARWPTEERSRAAAEAVANYENRLAQLGSDITLLKWMAGFNIALSVATPAPAALLRLNVPLRFFGAA